MLLVVVVKKNVLSIIEQHKAEGTYEESKEYLLHDLEKAKHFTTFGIGYNGYCLDGYQKIQSIINSG